MRTKHHIALGGTVVLTVLGSVAIVAGGWRTDGPMAPAAREADDNSGDVARARADVTLVDADAGRVVLSLPGEEVHLRVDERTTVFVNGRPGDLDEIEEGESVCAAWKPERAPVAEWLEPCSR